MLSTATALTDKECIAPRARKMGPWVTVSSRTLDKREDSRVGGEEWGGLCQVKG